MSCYHPLRAFRTPQGVVFEQLGRHDILGSIELPCGHCIGCRMRRASDWEIRIMHEASMHDENCFVTLTYGENRVPADGSLDHRDFQLFMKRLRRRFSLPVRFYMCGEYGEERQRPHYHVCVFGVGFLDGRKPKGKSESGHLYYEHPVLSELWEHGFATVQDLTRETASYAARYVMKKRMGQDAELHYGVRKPEYSAMSLRPGIGARWFSQYVGDVFPHDFVIADGKERQVPRYYDRLAKRCGIMSDEIEFSRVKRAEEARADNTDERRAVREIVHIARCRTLKRSVE